MFTSVYSSVKNVMGLVVVVVDERGPLRHNAQRRTRH